jgi:2'-5' RNA ligase
MTFSLQVFFDTAGDTAVRRMWSRLDHIGIPSLATQSHQRHRPHITLAGAGQLAVNDIALTTIARLPGIEVTLPVLGAFPGARTALVLGATATSALLEAHAAIHAEIEGSCEGTWALYRPDSWVPHCTLAMGLDAKDLATAIAHLHPHTAVTVRIAQIGIVDNESGEIIQVG